MRTASLNLTVGACALALILALPVWDFGAVSARNQIERLESGEVTPDKFDFAALRFHFGASGEAALAELAAGEGEVAKLAAEAQELDSRPWRGQVRRAEADLNYRLDSDDLQLRAEVIELLRDEPYMCRDFCVVLDLGQLPNGKYVVAIVDRYTVMRRIIGETSEGADAALATAETVNSKPELGPESTVEVREVTRQQVFVDGKPFGEPLRDADDATDTEPLILTVTTTE